MRHSTSKLWPTRLEVIKIFAIVSPYGLAKKIKKVTFKLYIIPPAAGVAYVISSIHQNIETTEVQVIDSRDEPFSGFDIQNSNINNERSNLLQEVIGTLEAEIKEDERELGAMFEVVIEGLDAENFYESEDHSQGDYSILAPAVSMSNNPIMSPDISVLSNYISLPLQMEMSATVLHNESSKRLFLCPSASWRELRSFQEYLQSLAASIPEFPPTDLVIGQMVLCQSETDSVWYRGTVLTLLEDSANIHCPDFGHCEKISLRNIRPVTDLSVSRVKYYASLCTLIRLGTVEPGGVDDTQMELDRVAARLLKTQQVMVKVVQRMELQFLVEIISETVSLQQQAKDDRRFGFSHLPKLKRPLGFKDLGAVVWEESSKGSVRNHRPWFRIFGKENPETLRPLFKSVIEPQVESEEEKKLIFFNPKFLY